MIKLVVILCNVSLPTPIVVWNIILLDIAMFDILLFQDSKTKIQDKYNVKRIRIKTIISVISQTPLNFFKQLLFLLSLQILNFMKIPRYEISVRRYHLLFSR